MFADISKHGFKPPCLQRSADPLRRPHDAANLGAGTPSLLSPTGDNCMIRPLRVAVQMDPIDSINIDADSTFALMLEAQSRGHAMWHYEVRHMALKEGVSRPQGGRREGRLFARGHKGKVARRHGAHFEFEPMETIELGSMDVVLMRQ